MTNTATSAPAMAAPAQDSTESLSPTFKKLLSTAEALDILLLEADLRQHFDDKTSWKLHNGLVHCRSLVSTEMRRVFTLIEARLELELNRGV